MGCPGSQVSARALSQSSDFASGKSAREAYCKIKKKPQRNTYRGFFPHMWSLGHA